MLKVTISGPPASGKTTLAGALNDFLMLRGFKNVVVQDDDIDVNRGSRPTEFNDMCMEAMAKKEQVVIITTVNTRR